MRLTLLLETHWTHMQSGLSTSRQPCKLLAYGCSYKTSYARPS